ncbi:m7GpppX diphosphatase-like [Styela clava]
MGEEEDEPSPKLAKIDVELHPFHRLKNPVVLNEVKEKKLVFLHGKVGEDNKDAVVILEKRPFDTSPKGLKSLFSEETKLRQDLLNDIYSTYAAVPTSPHTEIKTTVIYPATTKHIEKYTKQEVEVIEETGDDYKQITLPYLKEENRFSVQWVFNILDKKSESERIVFEDPDPEIGFILLPDMKWDLKDIESLYLMALVHRHDLKSLRDLNKDHLPLLKNIKQRGEDAIQEKYGVKKHKLRIYFHYQPSYYHLHIHFTNIAFDAPGSSVTRAHLLTDVIENIEFMSDYYQKKTMTFVGKRDDKLVTALRKTP